MVSAAYCKGQTRPMKEPSLPPTDNRDWRCEMPLLARWVVVKQGRGDKLAPTFTWRLGYVAWM